MNYTVEYPGSWSVFLNTQGMNVVDLFSGNQGFQGVVDSGVVGPAAQSHVGPACSVPGPRSSQIVAAVADLPSSSIGVRIGSNSTVQVLICLWLFYLKLTNMSLKLYVHAYLVPQDTKTIVISSEEIEAVIVSDEDEPETQASSETEEDRFSAFKGKTLIFP